MIVPISYYIILSGLVFLIGLVGVLIRRNIIIILLSIELMLNATNINFVAFSSYLGNVTWLQRKSPSGWPSLLPCIGMLPVSTWMTSGC
jgi:multisubunit Na+/H+ antiporter MnhC subunit